METLNPPSSLRPGELIRFAWRLLSLSLRPVVVISLVWTPITWCGDSLIPTVPDLFTVLVYLPLQAGFGLLHGSLAAALFLLIGRGRRRGDSLSVPLLLKEAVSAWPRVLWTQFLFMIAILIGLIALVVPGVYLAIRLVGAESVAVFEKRSGPAAFRRSFEMTHERLGDIMVLFLVYTGIGLALGVVYCTIESFFPYAGTWPVQAAGHLCDGIVMAFLNFFLLGIYEVLSKDPGEPTRVETVEAGGIE